MDPKIPHFLALIVFHGAAWVARVTLPTNPRRKRAYDRYDIF